MKQTTYDKTQITVPQQIELLKSQGLTFHDERKAEHLLNNISLFRIKSYLQPLRLYGKQEFKPNATFEEAYNLYKFDSELRKMVCSELEKIEISIRTQLSLIMGNKAGIFWFADSSNFRDVNRHSGLLNSLNTELNRSDDDAIIRFRQNYTNPFPPSWMVFEISSFGTISMMYRWLNAGHARRDVAKYYGLSDTLMESWLHSIVYVRNICAHHSRLWNRRLSINALIPRHTKLTFIDTPLLTLNESISFCQYFYIFFKQLILITLL